MLDVLVVGTGFGGIYMLHKLHNDLGLDAVAIDKAAGVGGTWYWNKYPGALSDSESFVYQYSFDRELYEQTPWTTKFARQPEKLLIPLPRKSARAEFRVEVGYEGSVKDGLIARADSAGRWTSCPG